MFFTRLMFFFVLISYYLTSSCFIWKKNKPEPEPEPEPEPKANPDEVAEFNRIIESKGWKSITGILRCDNYYIWTPATVTPFSSTELINETDFKMKKKFASMVLSAFYDDMLTKLFEIYREMLEKHDDKTLLIERFEFKFNKSFMKFKPLINCMLDALNYFKIYDYSNTVFSFLNELLRVMTELNEKCYVISFTKEIQNVIKSNEKYKSFTGIVEVVSSEVFVNQYIEELRKLGGDSKIMMLDPDNYLDINKKVQQGVDLFCKNFGFTE